MRRGVRERERGGVYLYKMNEWNSQKKGAGRRRGKHSIKRGVISVR